MKDFVRGNAATWAPPLILAVLADQGLTEALPIKQFRETEYGLFKLIKFVSEAYTTDPIRVKFAGYRGVKRTLQPEPAHKLFVYVAAILCNIGHAQQRDDELIVQIVERTFAVLKAFRVQSDQSFTSSDAVAAEYWLGVLRSNFGSQVIKPDVLDDFWTKTYRTLGALGVDNADQVPRRQILSACRDGLPLAFASQTYPTPWDSRAE